jgi:transcriptional regulator with XRE-family HTH domain
MKNRISKYLNNSLVIVMTQKDEVFSSRLLALRKQKGWSQPKLAKKVDTSGAIIGRYERGEITPSIGVARKLAEALEVTLDYLVGDNELNTLQDKVMLNRWQSLETLKQEDKDRILYVIDSLMRDAKTRQAYHAGIN